MDTGFKSVRNLPLRLAGLLLILVLASSAGIGKTLASYITSDSASDAAPNSGETACTLTVTWPETENDLEYANNAASELTVRLQAVQVD